jgi:hypothetical protein
MAALTTAEIGAAMSESASMEKSQDSRPVEEDELSP